MAHALATAPAAMRAAWLTKSPSSSAPSLCTSNPTPAAAAAVGAQPRAFSQRLPTKKDFSGRAVPSSFSLKRLPLSRRQSVKVYAAAAGVKTGRPSHGFDYYELLGVGPAADVVQIKQAYRWLQKRCHPDVAGDQLGHDMAVLLNEAYSILSDDQLRAAYDHSRVMWIEDEEYTGQPLHSTWHGHPEEQTAVFVEETTCVGCLNCALIASETFAIETKYGRARCVRQWGNDERTITDAIASCPVNCIHLVEREKLPALEYIMAQLPRHGVGVEMRMGGGLKQANVDVFQATEQFLAKRERLVKEGGVDQETPAQKAARCRAAEAIQATQGLRGMDLSWFMGQPINGNRRNRAPVYRGPQDSTTRALVWVNAKGAQTAAAAGGYAFGFVADGGRATGPAVDYDYFGGGDLGASEGEYQSDPLPYYAPDVADDVDAHRPSDALKTLQEAAARRQGGTEAERETVAGIGLSDEYWQAPKRPVVDPEEQEVPVGAVFEYSADGQSVKRRRSFAKEHSIKNARGGRSRSGSQRATASGVLAGVNGFQEKLQKRAGSEWVARIPAFVAFLQAIRVGLTYEEAAEVTSFAAHELNSISEVMLAANAGVVPRMLFSGVAWYTIAAAACGLLAGALAVMDESKAMVGSEDAKQDKRDG